MRSILVLTAALALSGCATTRSQEAAALPQQMCPSGQEAMRTSQLFFGRDAVDAQAVTESDFRRFVDEVMTPAFPAGLTVLEGGGQWRGAENQLIREASKVAIIVLPERRDADRRINAIREAYKARFKQASVLMVTQLSCVAI